MFLLFSCSAAGGSLIEEVESGTLDRVLLSRRSAWGGCCSASGCSSRCWARCRSRVMFAWGALVFRVSLLDHLAGFAIDDACHRRRAASFGLVLATACRSRAQLPGSRPIVILMMSALGGSMFPRFLMSERMQKLSLLTFNGWALDGYIKVFWRDAPLGELWPQLLVLAGFTAVFLASRGGSRGAGRRRERGRAGPPRRPPRHLAIERAARGTVGFRGDRPAAPPGAAPP